MQRKIEGVFWEDADLRPGDLIVIRQSRYGPEARVVMDVDAYSLYVIGTSGRFNRYSSRQHWVIDVIVLARDVIDDDVQAHM